VSAPSPEAPAGAGSARDGRVFFPGDDRLEGVLEWPEAAGQAERLAGGVVVAHPHSLSGGTMSQPVVYRVAQACRERGLATLRFNFRGVGESLGTYSGTEEYRDVQAAAAFLWGRMAAIEGDAVPGPGTPPLALAGYSFGSIMVARAAAEAGPVAALALIGFVTSWPELPPDTFARLAEYRGPVLAVCAEHDDIGYPEEVEKVLTELGLDFTVSVVKGAGHFLEGRQREVGEIVAEFLARELSLAHAAGE
jgi:alpha/beta superfamily hydrolase